MATYRYKDGYGYPPDFYGSGCFRRRVDVPSLIANGGLTDTAGADATLASTGFAISDILQVFLVPKGFSLRYVAVNVVTADSAAVDIDVGNNSATQTHFLAIDADGYMGTCALNTATWKQNLIADVQLGGSTYEGVIFVTNGSIDITFNTAACAEAIFDIACCGYMLLREDQK